MRIKQVERSNLSAIHSRGKYYVQHPRSHTFSMQINLHTIPQRKEGEACDLTEVDLLTVVGSCVIYKNRRSSWVMGSDRLKPSNLFRHPESRSSSLISGWAGATFGYQQKKMEHGLIPVSQNKYAFCGLSKHRNSGAAKMTEDFLKRENEQRQ